MYDLFKRLFDILISFIALILLTPLMLLISLIILVTMGCPIVIKQKRVGRYNHIFTLYKFRTMTNGKNDQSGENRQECTRFGRFLRHSSLDELPQLVNVLVGHMSLIGPRPKTLEEIAYVLDKAYVYRHILRPGLTGLAAVKGRNALNPDEAYQFDLDYIKKVSLITDIKIFLQTFEVVLRRKGVNRSENVSFIPHDQFWEQQQVLTKKHIVDLKKQIDVIEKSKLTHLGKLQKNDFIKQYKEYKNGRRTAQ